MTRKIAYTATFSNGEVLTRKSHREYTAAYFWLGTRVDDGRTVRGEGFSRTRELAEKALRADSSWYGIKVIFSEVVDATQEGGAA